MKKVWQLQVRIVAGGRNQADIKLFVHIICVCHDSDYCINSAEYYRCL